MAIPSIRNRTPALAVLLGVVVLLLLPTLAMAPPAAQRIAGHVANPIGASTNRGSRDVGGLAQQAGSAPRERSPAAPPSNPRGVGEAAPLPPRPAIVNPLQYHTREPAPMGIADFGVTGTSPGATAYEYNASSFQGQAIVRSLSVTISGSASKVTAFELNAVVVLQSNGTTYSYWIQNGLHLDAGSDEFTIGGAYVWNFSSAGATLTSGELTGATGSVLSGDTYYYIPGCGPSYPGQCSTLSLPATLTGRIVTSTSGGVPFVAYQYNLGSGWVTYDNVSFPRLTGGTDAGFRVDGFAPTPYAAQLYYGAEWVWVGAGGGSASTDQGSNINLTLSLWNGHNYQAIPNAWNFGSNTGESSSNVSESPTVPLGAHVASGAGTLGVLYNQSGVGFLNLSAPTRGPATVLVDGIAIPFVHGGANVTLAAGSHTLDLENYSNASTAFQVHAGETTFLNLSGAGSVTISETGLPAHTSWGIVVNGTAYSTSGSDLALNLPNGTYPLAYSTVAGYDRVGSNPTTLTVPESSGVALVFAPFTFAVNFAETGLPLGTLWWILDNGTRYNSTGASVQVPAPNGSTPYQVGSPYAYLASPRAGSIVVSAGVSSPMSVTFTERPTFIAGTLVPANATLTIDGESQSVADGVFNVSVAPGTFALEAAAPGYASLQRSVTTTPGNVSWANLTLTANQSQGSNASSPSSNSGGVSALTAALVVTSVVVVALVAVVVLIRRRK